MPLFHAYGLNTGLGTVAHHAATGVLVDRFDPAASLAVIAERAVTVAVGVPGDVRGLVPAARRRPPR